MTAAPMAHCQESTSPGIALRTYSIIGLGSALGGLARYLCGVAVSQWSGQFPWGTLLVNVLGSLVIGCFATLTGPDGRLYVRTTGRQFVMIGICGGFTTFSAFSLETLQLLRAHRPTAALAYVLLSILLGLTAVWAGHIAARKVNR